ncbi:hypothetical protein pb186bvf_019744 [Paramecium bursaria]
MIQVQNDKDALQSKNKFQFQANQGNLFQIKISKNIHSLILSYLSFKGIMSLKLVDQYNRNLVLCQYPELIQKYQNQLVQLKEQDKTNGMGQLEQFKQFDSYGWEYQIPEYQRYDYDLDKNQLKEFLGLKNSHKLIEDLKIVLNQLVHNTVNIDYNYRNWVKGIQQKGQLNNYIHQIHQKLCVVDLKKQVLNSIRTFITEDNQAQIKSISLAANHIFYYIKGVYLYSELPQLKLLKEINQVEKNLKILLNGKHIIQYQKYSLLQISQLYIRQHNKFYPIYLSTQLQTFLHQLLFQTTIPFFLVGKTFMIMSVMKKISNRITTTQKNSESEIISLTAILCQFFFTMFNVQVVQIQLASFNYQLSHLNIIQAKQSNQ